MYFGEKCAFLQFFIDKFMEARASGPEVQAIVV